MKLKDLVTKLQQFDPEADAKLENFQSHWSGRGLPNFYPVLMVYTDDEAIKLM